MAFVRVTRCQETVIEDFSLTEVSITSKGPRIGGKIRKRKRYQWYAFTYFILPLSGWWNNFIHIGQPKIYQITKYYY